MGEWLEFVKPFVRFSFANWGWLSLFFWAVYVGLFAVFDKSKTTYDVWDDYLVPIGGSFVGGVVTPFLIVIAVMLFPIFGVIGAGLGLSGVAIWFGKKKRGVI